MKNQKTNERVEDVVREYQSQILPKDKRADWLRTTLTQAITEARQEGYASGYKQGRFDVEVELEK